MAFRFSKNLVGHGFTPRFARPIVSWPMQTLVHLNPASTANVVCKFPLLQEQTQKISSLQLADCKSCNSEHVRQHDRWYSQIFDNLLLQASDYDASAGGVGKYFGGRETSVSEHQFWTYLLFVKCVAHKVNIRELLLAAYSDGVKSCRGNPLWTETTFANLPSGFPCELGTYILETSSGYSFTGASYQDYAPSCTSEADHSLHALQQRFDSFASRGFENLRCPTPEMDENARFNLWLMRECSRPSVSYQHRALGVLPTSLLVKFIEPSLENKVDLLKLMGTIDTIYNGSIMGTDFGEGGVSRQSKRALALEMRPMDMPKPCRQGANRTLACFTAAI